MQMMQHNERQSQTVKTRTSNNGDRVETAAESKSTNYTQKHWLLDKSFFLIFHALSSIQSTKARAVVMQSGGFSNIIYKMISKKSEK